MQIENSEGSSLVPSLSSSLFSKSRERKVGSRRGTEGSVQKKLN